MIYKWNEVKQIELNQNLSWYVKFYLYFYPRIGLAYIGRAGSTATTVSISIERHLAIGHPTTITPFKLLFWAPIVFAITYNIPKFFEMAACDVTEVVAENVTTTYLRLSNLTTEKNDMLHEIDMSNSTDASLANNATIDQEWCDADGMRATSLRQNEWYLIFYVVISKVVLVEVVPWLTVIALNVWTWRKMVVFQRKREAMLKKGKKGKLIWKYFFKALLSNLLIYDKQTDIRDNDWKINCLFLGSTICQQTKILVGMVVVFIFCQFFPIVGDVYELVCLLTGNNTEGICKSNIHIENCINFGHFMLMVNSSVNFVFYMTNIAKFREGFLQVRYDIVCEHVISSTHELY